jgi:SpoVK/Ycf46/Vps4 family AAA+-type ATPase
LEGLNIKGPVTLARIESAVRRFKESRGRLSDSGLDSPRMNLLLYGPPGTGKTAFIHHLGASLNLNVVTRTGSDLLGKYVGETEKNIRNAFREAGHEGVDLFLDEIDGLLRNRARAERVMGGLQSQRNPAADGGVQPVPWPVHQLADTSTPLPCAASPSSWNSVF